MARPLNKRGGRPRIVIEWRELDNLCYLQCTLREIADWFKCSEDTIERRVREEKQVTFAEYFRKMRVGGKIALRRNMMQMSETHPQMAIFLAKNWLGMTDKQDVAVEGEIVHRAVDPEVIKAIADTEKRLKEIETHDYVVKEGVSYGADPD